VFQGQTNGCKIRFLSSEIKKHLGVFSFAIDSLRFPVLLFQIVQIVIILQISVSQPGCRGTLGCYLQYPVVLRANAFFNVLLKRYLKISLNHKSNCYGFAPRCRKWSFSFVGCRKSKNVGNHCFKLYFTPRLCGTVVRERATKPGKLVPGHTEDSKDGPSVPTGSPLVPSVDSCKETVSSLPVKHSLRKQQQGPRRKQVEIGAVDYLWPSRATEHEYNETEQRYPV